MAEIEQQDGKVWLSTCIEHQSDDDMFWSVNIKYLDPNCPLSEIIGEKEREAFDKTAFSENLVLCIEDESECHLLPSHMLVSDLNNRDRSQILVTRSRVEAKVKRIGFKSFSLQISDGFTFRKLKRAIELHTGIPMVNQYVRCLDDVENRNARILGRMDSDANPEALSASSSSKSVSEVGESGEKMVRMKFQLSQVEPINIRIATDVSDRELELTVCPKMMPQRMMQNLANLDSFEISWKTHFLAFGEVHLPLASPYGFCCMDYADTRVNTLECYGLQSGDLLHFKKRDPSHRIHVKTISGHHKILEGFSSKDFVSEIMWKVAEANGWEWPDLLKLLHGSKTLSPTKQLALYHIDSSENDPLLMVPTMRRS
jgi:hypothetical protein